MVITLLLLNGSLGKENSLSHPQAILCPRPQEANHPQHTPGKVPGQLVRAVRGPHMVAVAGLVPLLLVAERNNVLGDVQELLGHGA